MAVLFYCVRDIERLEKRWAPIISFLLPVGNRLNLSSLIPNTGVGGVFYLFCILPLVIMK